MLQSGMNEFYLQVPATVKQMCECPVSFRLQLGAYDRFQHCFLCAAADATGIQYVETLHCDFLNCFISHARAFSGQSPFLT